MQHKLKELRKDLNLTQSDIYAGICSRYTYSRLEKGSQEIPFELLDQFLKRMGFPLRQYLDFLENYDDSNEFRKIEKQLPDLITKSSYEQQNFLDTKFRYVQQNRFKNIYALLVFIQVKSTVAAHLKVKVPPLSRSDLKEIEEFYYNRNYILPIDLAILGNIIPSYTCEELQTLEHLIIKPIEPDKLKDNDFKKLASIYINFIIHSIREDNLTYAENYLQKLIQLVNNKINYYFQYQCLFFKNIINFMKKEDVVYLQRAIEIINLIEQLKDYTTANSLRQEINQLLNMKQIELPQELLFVGKDTPNYLPMFE